MYRSISSFNKNIPILLISILLFCLEAGCTPKATSSMPFFSKNGYVILPNDSTAPSDIRWAEYLYTHLKNRATEKDIIQNRSSLIGYNRIIVEMDSQLKVDYKITKNNDQIKITAVDNQAMLWLIYQFMKKLSSDDSRFKTEDLPPAVIEMKNSQASFGFRYRAIYSPTNLQTDYAGIAGTNNIENDWGIWGHNLNKVIGEDVPQDVYALINGKRDHNQYCFSSNALYSKIESFITENYGEKVHNSFVIAPNDNLHVCQCPLCIKNGNSVSYATPAVTQLIIKLAKRFPMHSFFTTSYLTTSEAPKTVLPSNVGVIISAINLPFTCNKDHSSLKSSFLNTMKKWSSLTSNIYVWDYINNFDDYLTPFPVLNIMKERFLLFKENGATGIILNGSGYEYSTFDDLKTFALSALMINPNFAIEGLTTDFLQTNYPNSKKLINSYYLSLENRINQNKKKLNIYGGIKDAITTYLDKTEFIDFYNNLSKNLEQLKGEERKKVHKLIIALSYTRLEIARSEGYGEYGCYIDKEKKTDLTPSVTESMNRLNNSVDFKDMKYYNESESLIESYQSDWKNYIINQINVSNLLRGVKLKPIDQSIGEDMNVELLTDGIRGLPSNYHFGWGITTLPIIEFEIPTQAVTNFKYIEIGFLQQKKHRIIAPSRVEIWIDGKVEQLIQVNKTKDGNDQNELWKAFAPLSFKPGQTMKLRIIPAKTNRVQTAMDEILLIP